MTRDVLNEQVKLYLMQRVLGVMEWYTTGAVDCSETRTNMNRELASVLRETERKFGIKPFKRVLRVCSDGAGFLKVRWEERDLS